MNNVIAIQSIKPIYKSSWASQRNKAKRPKTVQNRSVQSIQPIGFILNRSVLSIQLIGFQGKFVSSLFFVNYCFSLRSSARTRLLRLNSSSAFSS